jgi:hypothetical protein
MLCEPDDDSVNWEHERLSGRLFVLVNKYRRLRAEHDAMDPWTARETRVKVTLATQADEIAAVLRMAGVTL